MIIYSEASAALRDLLHELHDVEIPTPAFIAKVEKHAAVASQCICTNCATLNITIIRYEALIRKRWMKKSPAARRELLLAVWPSMPEGHLSDKYLRAKQEQQQKQGTGSSRR
jgi:hypothetical protein